MAAGLYLTGAASAQGDSAQGDSAQGDSAQGDSAQGGTLAVHGGAKAVTAAHDDATTWPRYGAEEEQAVLELVRNPNYGPIEAFESEWKQQFNLAYCKAHYNGTSAITAMFFAHAAYHEPQWWHHQPVIADRYPGAEEANRRGISLPYSTKDVPELVDQYIEAFEKVWTGLRGR
ncbi:MAG: hypothetical protein ACYC3X_08080 [Pirellulaceae bacterium]